MTREEIIDYVEQNYNALIDDPWANDQTSLVIRHSISKKWFGLIMNIPKNKLDAKSQENIDIINLKVNPDLIDLLLSEKGFYRAYHMNKNNWITIDIKDAKKDLIIKLIDLSYDLTKNQHK